MRLPESPKRPELDALIERARAVKMTPEMRAAQRRSWVTGEMMLEHPEMTKEQADALYDRVILCGSVELPTVGAPDAS